MNYITHRRFKGKAICGELNLRYNTPIVCLDNILFTIHNEPICFATSENAMVHFARNDDGMGLERGSLTYAIAYGKRKGANGFRFTEAEREMLVKDYPHWLRQDTEYLLFNDDFFAATVEELRELADKLKIKV